MERKICYALVMASLLISSVNAWAGADVLPKGNFAFNVDYTHYIPWDKRFDKHGKTQDAASDFNVVLDNSIIGELPDGANVGASVVSFKYKLQKIDTTLAYGITDTVAVGVKVPYLWMENKVKAKLDTSGANVPGYTTEDIQNYIQSAYGFKPIADWKQEGVGDIETGVKYQYYKSNNWALAAQGGALFPTGKVDDPDNLVDQPLGGGSYSLLFRSYNDYTGIKNLVLSGSAFYTLTLEQDRKKRIVSDPHKPLTDVEQKVTIDTGDLLELEASVKYQFNDIPPLAGTSLEVMYHYGHCFKDRVTGSNGRISAMEEETDSEEHVLLTTLAYSTIPQFLKKQFPVPLDLSLTYRNRFAGNNNAFKTQYLQGGITFYF